MNEHRSLEHEIRATLDEKAPMLPPNHLLHSFEFSAGRTRRYPRWLALLKEPPMRTNSYLAVGSPTTRAVAVVAATMLLAVALAVAGFAGSRLLAADGTIVVDQDGNGTVTTITEAVAMAEDGDTILVRPGTYDESITLTKDVTIRGDGDRNDEVIVELSVEIPPGASGDGPDLPAAFHFDGSDASLENLTVRGESSRIVISGGAPVLRDLVIEGIGRVYALDAGQPTPTGLNLLDGTTVTITNSVLTDTDIDIETGSSPSLVDNVFSIGAIWMQGTGVDPVIQGNEIAASGKWGISVGGGAQPVIEANTITGASTGIEVADSGWRIPDTGTDAVIRGNTISGSGLSAVRVDRGASATIESNVLLDNPLGITVYTDVLIEGNRVEDGTTGISAGGGSPSLVDNVVEGMSKRGIVVANGASPILRGNTSCNNGQNLVVMDGATPDIDDTNEICEEAPAG